tara:strand:- start:1940 stop:3184 length:1245 start_codon:yes stop_codon:yes gene_type:complete
LLEKQLHFNYKDIFLAPRIGLSPKKIWIFILGNLTGYIGYWVLSFLAMILSNVNIIEALYDFGLYPYLAGGSYSPLSWIIFYFGILFWLYCLLISSTAISRLTIRQLRGDNFYSINEAIDDALKKWKTILFSPITFVVIILSLFLIGSSFALIGSIPYIGSFLLAITFPLYFFGAIFLLFTFLVFLSSFLMLPSLVGAYDEDTVGSVFQSYQILFNQPWRLIFYNLLLLPIIVISLNIFSWFYETGFAMINFIFSELIGSTFPNILSYATSILNIDFILRNISVLQSFTFQLKTLSLDIIGFFVFLFNETTNLLVSTLPDLTYNSNGGYINSIEAASGLIISIILIFIYISFISYGFSILAVGETIIFIIFKKLMEGENLLIHNNSSNSIDNDPSNLSIDESSAKVLGLSKEEE